VNFRTSTEANVFEQSSKSCFRTYGKTGNGEEALHLHSPEEAAEQQRRLGTRPGSRSVHPLEPILQTPIGCCYERPARWRGGRGLMTWPRLVDLADRRSAIANLEWIQEDQPWTTPKRGYSAEVDSSIRSCAADA